MSSAVALARRVQPFLARPQSGCMQEAVRARKTRLCGGAPLMCAAAARARPDRFGLLEQAGADRRTPAGGWGEPEPGRRSLQQRGEPARSGMPRPDGLEMTHTISGRAEGLESRSFRERVKGKLCPAAEMKGVRPWSLVQQSRVRVPSNDATSGPGSGVRSPAWRARLEQAPADAPAQCGSPWMARRASR